MNINLKKPLAIFDLEATGLDVTSDRIVEIAVVKINPDGTRTDFHQRINPQIPIPKEVTAIHGIGDEDVKDAPTFKDILPELEKFIENTDFAGFNSNKFDLPLLAEEFLRAGSEVDLSVHKHIDVQNIFHKMEQRTLEAAYRFYCEKNLENAHTAMADAEATWEVLNAQIQRYSTLEDNVDFLSEFSIYGDVSRLDFAGRLALNEKGEAIYNFGKHKGKTIREVMKLEPGYYGWMLDANFPLYTKQCLRKEMERIKAEESARAPKSEQSMQAKLDALKNKFSTK